MKNIPQQFIALLRDIVLAQDAGISVAEDLQKAFISLSTIDRLMVEASFERLRMSNEGLPVYVPDSQGRLILGLDDKPHKQPGTPIPEPKSE